MTTINLRQNQQDDQFRFSAKSGNSGFAFSLGILVFTLLVLTGLKFYVPIAEGKNAILTNDITVGNQKLIGLKSLASVIDMQVRIDEIKNNLQLKDGNVTRLEVTKLLDHLSGDLDPGTVVSEFRYSPDNVSVSFVTNNYGDAARQILNFKKSQYFSEVNLTNISRTENTISASVTMNVNK